MSAGHTGGTMMIVGWANTFSGDVWCRGEHDTEDDVLGSMGPMQREAVDLEVITLGEAEAADVSMICNTCGRPVQRWLVEDTG